MESRSIFIVSGLYALWMVAFFKWNNLSTLPIHQTNDTFATLRASGYNVEVDFLQSKIIVPFGNRAIYQNSDQLAEKLPKGLLLTGKNKVGVVSIISALKTELSISDGSYFSRNKDQKFQYNFHVTGWVSSLFNMARKSSPSIIFLEDVATWHGYGDKEDFKSYAFMTINEELGKTTPGEILVVISAEEESQVEYYRRHWEYFTTRLYIHRHLTSQERKILLCSATSGWAIPPGEDILNVMADKTGELMSYDAKIDIEHKIRSLSVSVYRTCLEEYLKKLGNVKEIDSKGINPTLQHWEDALNNMLPRRKSSPKVNSNIKPQMSKSNTIVPELAKIDPSVAGGSSGIHQEKLKENITTEITANSADHDSISWVCLLTGFYAIFVLHFFLWLKEKDPIKQAGDMSELNISAMDKTNLQIESFATLRETGYNSEVDFLESKVVTHFRNIAIYQNSGQLNEKLPKGLLLTGKNKKGVASIISALKTELFNSGEKNWSYFARIKNQTFEHNFEVTWCVHSLFEMARKSLPALIIFEDVATWSSCGPEKDLKSYAFISIKEEIEKTTPGEILVVASAEEESQLEYLGYLRHHKCFTTTLYIPRLLTSQERRTLLQSATSGWAIPPGEEVLEVMSEKTGELMSNKSKVDIEKRIRSLSVSVYRTCLEEYLKKSGIKGEIDPNDINPTLQQWEDALNKMLPQKKSLGYNANTKTNSLMSLSNIVVPKIAAVVDKPHVFDGNCDDLKQDKLKDEKNEIEENINIDAAVSDMEIQDEGFEVLRFEPIM